MAVVLLAVALAACAGDVAGRAEPAPQAATEQGLTAAACRPVEQVPVQGGEHLLGDQEPPVPYNSVPPTSGWHSSGTLDIEVRAADDPLTEPQQVSVLEAGAVVVSHRGLSDADLRALTRLVETSFAGRVAVTPYERLDPGQVALTAWGRLQRCDRFDPDAVSRFVDRYAAEQPSRPGHGH